MKDLKDLQRPVLFVHAPPASLNYINPSTVWPCRAEAYRDPLGGIETRLRGLILSPTQSRRPTLGYL